MDTYHRAKGAIVVVVVVVVVVILGEGCICIYD